MNVTVTKAEDRAIMSLQRAIKKLPSTLSLFGYPGSLGVIKKSECGSIDCNLGYTFDVYCDGGDPSAEDVCPEPEVEYIDEEPTNDN